MNKIMLQGDYSDVSSLVGTEEELHALWLTMSDEVDRRALEDTGVDYIWYRLACVAQSIIQDDPGIPPVNTVFRPVMDMPIRDLPQTSLFYVLKGLHYMILAEGRLKEARKYISAVRKQCYFMSITRLPKSILNYPGFYVQRAQESASKFNRADLVTEAGSGRDVVSDEKEEEDAEETEATIDFVLHASSYLLDIDRAMSRYMKLKPLLVEGEQYSLFEARKWVMSASENVKSHTKTEVLTEWIYRHRCADADVRHFRYVHPHATTYRWRMIMYAKHVDLVDDKLDDFDQVEARMKLGEIEFVRLVTDAMFVLMSRQYKSEFRIDAAEEAQQYIEYEPLTRSYLVKWEEKYYFFDSLIAAYIYTRKIGLVRANGLDAHIMSATNL